MANFQMLAADFFRDILRFDRSLSLTVPSTLPLVGAALRIAHRHRIVSFCESTEIPEAYHNAGFYLSPANVTFFNTDAMELLCAVIDADLAAGAITSLLADDLRKRAVELFLAHEIFHQEQGLVQFSHVQMIKSAYGSGTVIGHLDLAADLAAAHFVAALEINRGATFCVGSDAGLSECVARHVLATLMVAGEYGPRAFGCPEDKPHKIRRAAGLSLAATVALRISEGDRRYTSIETVEPFWTPSTTPGKYLLSALIIAPKEGLWSCIEVDERVLATWLAHVKSGRFAASVLICSDILNEWRVADRASPGLSIPHP